MANTGGIYGTLTEEQISTSAGDHTHANVTLNSNGGDQAFGLTLIKKPEKGEVLLVAYFVLRCPLRSKPAYNAGLLLKITSSSVNSPAYFLISFVL